jgi:hypothetical protein
MDDLAANDPRVLAILMTPDEYFARARRQAWLRAKEDVAADLQRRAQRRRNGIWSLVGRSTTGSTESAD